MVSRLKKQRTIYNTARTNRKRIESKLVPMVDRQLEDARRLVRMGEADPLLLLESLLRAQQIKFQLIDVKLKEAQATNALRYLLGATESL
jgi:outer membrane protein TolC